MPRFLDVRHIRHLISNCIWNIRYRMEKWKKADLVLITSSLMALYGEKVKEGNVCILDESGQIIGMEGRNVYNTNQRGVYQRLLNFVRKGWMLQGERNSWKKGVCVCRDI